MRGVVSKAQDSVEADDLNKHHDRSFQGEGDVWRYGSRAEISRRPPHYFARPRPL